MWFTMREDPTRFIEVPIARVKEILKMNKEGKKPAFLVEEVYSAPVVKHDYENVVGQDELTRFDRPKGQGGDRNKGAGNKRRKNRNKNRKPGGDRPQNAN